MGRDLPRPQPLRAQPQAEEPRQPVPEEVVVGALLGLREQEEAVGLREARQPVERQASELGPMHRC